MFRFPKITVRTAALMMIIAVVMLLLLAVPPPPNADAQTNITVQFERTNYNVLEGNTLYATLTLSAAATADTTFSVTTTAGSATSGTDFPAGPHSVSVSQNETQKTLAISIPADTTIEGTEDFTITIASPPTGYTLGTNSSATVQIVDVNVVPTNWALIPSGLGPGEEFRLLFKTGNQGGAGADTISSYDTFVRTRTSAHPWHSAIQTYSNTFRVVGSTPTVDAAWHTSTGIMVNSQPSHTPFSHRIYWLNGPKIADDYNDFWDGNWDANADADMRHADGLAATNKRGPNTGTRTGTTHATAGVKKPNRSLGHSSGDVRWGGTGNQNPIDQGEHGSLNMNVYLGLSSVFRVDPGAGPKASIAGETRQISGSDWLYELTDIDEGQPAVFTVRLASAPTAAVTVNVAVSETSGGARDYIAAADERTHQVTIAANSTEANLSIATTADTNDEATGMITAKVLPGTGYSMPTSMKEYMATIDVYDDDNTTVSFHNWGGQGTTSTAGVTISGRNVTTKENFGVHIELHISRPLVAGEELYVPVAIGGTATAGCVNVRCDESIDLKYDMPDVQMYNDTPYTESGERRSRRAEDTNWGFVNLEDDDNVMFRIVMPAHATEDSPTEFALRLDPLQESGGADGSSETLTIQLDTRPATYQNSRLVHSRNLGRDDYTGSDTFVSDQVQVVGGTWIMTITNATVSGKISLLNHDYYMWTNSRGNTVGRDCRPKGNPAKLAISETAWGMGCNLYLADVAGSPVIPSAPLHVSITSSNPNALLLQDDTGATPRQSISMIFANDGTWSWASYRQVYLKPQIDSNGVNDTVTVTHYVSGGGPEYAALAGSHTFKVEVTEAVPTLPVTNVQVTPRDIPGVAMATWNAVPHAAYYEVKFAGTGDTTSVSGSGIVYRGETRWVFWHNATETMTITVTVTPQYADHFRVGHNVDSLAGTGTLNVVIQPPEDNGLGDGQGDGGSQDQFGSLDQGATYVQSMASTCTPQVLSDAQQRAGAAFYWHANHGWNAPLFWRILNTLGAQDLPNKPAGVIVETVTAEYVETYSEDRDWAGWPPIVKAMQDCVCEPNLPDDAVTVAEVTEWRDDNEGDADDTLRWNRVLAALGDDVNATPMTAEEAEEINEQFDNTQWERTVRTLGALEAGCIEISVSAGSDITEGGDATFTVSADPAPFGDLDVTIMVTQSGDFGVGKGTRTVTITDSGSATLTIATTDDSADEADGSVTAAVSAGESYAVSATAGSATVAVADDDDAPTPSSQDSVLPPSVTPEVSITAGGGIVEGGAASFTVSANPAPTTALTVAVYVTPSGNFGVTQGMKLVTIPTTGIATLTIATTNDSVDEPNGLVTAALSGGTGYTVSATAGTAMVTVADNDNAPPPVPTPVPTPAPTPAPAVLLPAVGITSTSDYITEGDAAVFMLTGPPNDKVTVTVNVSQTGDFGVAEGARTITAAPGSRNAIFSVATSDDGVAENDGAITVTLLDGDGYEVIPVVRTAVVTVEDDDSDPVEATLPTMTINGASASEDAGALEFIVTLSAASADVVTLPYFSISVGTATAGADYESVDGTLAFAPGETRKTIRVAIIDDAIAEDDETVKLILDYPTGATILDEDDRHLYGTIVDND